MTADPETARALEGRRALVTGASRGVGAGVARAFAERGARVGLLSRSGDDLGLPGALGVRCDVSSREDVVAAVEAVVERFGGLDCVVANAGVGMYGPFLDLEPDDIEAMVDVNLKGTVYTAQATLPHLIESKGDWVTLASVAGLRGFPGETVYNATKFGQVGFTRSLDHELRPFGVRVTTIAPGGVATDFAMGKGRTPEMPELEGMMSAEEVADVVLFAVTRPRDMRIMTVAFRPMNEGSWG
jgi:NAD(P)-dependent dehydrogenase (short-subunit alcohol dehydrogenase family)